MPKTSLNKCPACGGETNMSTADNLGCFRVYCNNFDCNMSGPWERSENKAARSWNAATAPVIDARKLAEYLREQFRQQYGDGDLVHLEILEKFLKAGIEAQEGRNG